MTGSHTLSKRHREVRLTNDTFPGILLNRNVNNVREVGKVNFNYRPPK